MINDRRGGELTLDEYIDQGEFCIDLPKYSDVDENILVDRVIKYESLIDDLGEVLDQLGVPFNGSLGVNAKSNHRMDRSHYSEILTDAQTKIIGNAFSREIDLHGYTY